MIKLILRPTLIVVVPQLAALAFYGLLSAVVGASDGLRIGYVVLACIVFLAGGVGAAIDFFDNAIPEHKQELLRLRRRQERERLAAQIDAEIGIPRVGRR